MLSRRVQDKNPNIPQIKESVQKVLTNLSHYYYELSRRDQEIKILLEKNIEGNFTADSFKKIIQSPIKKKVALPTLGDDSTMRKHFKNVSPTFINFLEFYAIYCGFAGIKGFVNDITLYDCFGIRNNQILSSYKGDLWRLIGPEIKAWNPNILIQEYQAKEDFYTLYTGYYNVFFIDETTIHKGKENDPPEFEVANFIFEGKQGEFYFKKWDSDELEVNKVHPLKNSPRSNFYVQEVDEKWAYMFSFKRPRNIKAGIGRKFPFYYLGSTEPREEEFAGIGYAVKVESPDKLFVPQRES